MQVVELELLSECNLDSQADDPGCQGGHWSREAILRWFVPKLFGLQSEETTTFSCFIHFIHTFLQL